MYAIVKIGGNQYKVSPKQIVEVDRLEAADKSVVSFPSLLVVDGEKVTFGKEAEKILVKAKVLKKMKGEKIDVVRFRHKVRHRRHVGFRSSLTQIEIESIGDVVAKKIETKKEAVVKKVVKKSKTLLKTK
jgi:large subunit ribosomal protein L21